MYYSANEYFKNLFGEKVYKITLKGGMSCPNRDGTLGSRGCIFCSPAGSGDFAVPFDGDIEKAVALCESTLKRKSNAKKYIAYFQDFCNTYDTPQRLKSLYLKAINSEKIVGLSIATRPDLLGPDIIKLLNEINQIKPVFIELGLQTIHPKTAKYIRRGYPLEVFDQAIKNLKAIGVKIIVHQILGLPFETKEMMWDTAKYIGKSGVDGIKFHLLYVVKNTDLEKEYKAKVFETLSLEEYISILEGCIERLPQNVSIHRLTGDSAKRDLVAPLYSANKKMVLNEINRQFKTDGLVQGKLL